MRCETTTLTGGGVEFVYNPITNEFVAGTPKKDFFDGSPHEQLAQSIGSKDNPSLVGGTFQRGPNGEFLPPRTVATTVQTGQIQHVCNFSNG